MTWNDELRTLRAPEPPAELLSRILASRASGVRVALPTTPARAGLWHRPWYWTVAAAAGVALIVAAGIGLHRTGGTAEGGSWDAGIVLSPSEVYAQEPGGKLTTASYPVVETLDTSRVIKGRWVYRTRTIIDGFVTDTDPTDTLTVRATQFHELPALAIVSSRGSRPVTSRDTFIVDRRDLRPLRRLFFVGRILREFTYGPADVGPLFLVHVSKNYAGSRLNPSMQPTIGLVNFLQLKPLLQALPLDDGWRGSVYLRPFHGPYDPLPIDVRVKGRERCSVPAGTFECWRVELALPANRRPLKVWIRRGEQVVVRITQKMEDNVIEQVLVEAETTPPAP
jgi:hypothetical protein